MEQGLHLLEHAVAAILFCVALTLFLIQVNGYRNCLNELRESGMDQGICNQQSIQVQEDQQTFATELSGGELLASLLVQPLEYDIEIDGQLISRMEHSVLSTIKERLEVHSYRKHYVYDSEGAISRVVYQKIS